MRKCAVACRPIENEGLQDFLVTWHDILEAKAVRIAIVEATSQQKNLAMTNVSTQPHVQGLGIRVTTM